MSRSITGLGARVVFDPVGGTVLRAAYREYGALSGEPTPFLLFTVLGKSLTLKGYLYSEVVGDDAVLARAKAYITEELSSGGT